MAQRSFRIRDEILKKAQQAAKDRRFRSLNAFVQEAIANEVERGGTVIQETEARMVATLERLTKEVRKAVNAQQVHLGFTDALARYIFITTIEPPQDQLDASRARAGVRYEKYLRSVASNLSGDLKKTLTTMMDKPE